MRKLKLRKKITSSLLAFLIIFQTVAGVFLPAEISLELPYVKVQETQAEGENWLTGWTYRREVTIANPQTDFQTKVEIQGTDSEGANYVDFDKILALGADVRFTDSGGSNTLFYWIWIESWDDSAKTATIWVRTHGTTATPMYMYYGKAEETTTSSGTSTFEFFDDFTDGSSKWDAVGTATVNPEGYVYATKTGTGTVTSTLTSKTGEIGSGDFKATLKIMSSGSAGTGCSYEHKLKKLIPAETTIELGDYASYTTKSYDILSGTDVKLKLYASATGDQTGCLCSVSAESCEECDFMCWEIGDCCDCASYCPGPSADVCVHCDGYYPLTYSNCTDYSASASVYVDDVYVRKYASPEPTTSVGGEGTANATPSFTAGPSDGGSSATTPTESGFDVNFTATATDADGDSYYLALCKTDAITANNSVAPTCDGGNWCVSSSTVSGSGASCLHTTADSGGGSSANEWYGFVCDHNASSQCSASSQGSGDSGSSFYVNPSSWLSGYSYRKLVSLTGQSGAGANYQVELLIGKTSGAVDENFDLNGHCMDSFYDIRFTDNDGSVELDYWIESVADSGTSKLATVWVEVADDLGSNRDIYVYYGKMGDTDGSDGTETFIFFDDFTSASGWTTTDSSAINIESGVLTVKTTGADKKMYANNPPSVDDFVMRFKILPDGGTNYDMLSYLALQDSNNSWGAGTSCSGSISNSVGFIYSGGMDGEAPRYIKGRNVISSSCTDSSTIYNPTQTEWYEVKITKNGTSTITKIWDSSHSEASPNVNSDYNAPDVTLSYLVLSTNSNGGEPCDVDDLRVRKYIASEPAYLSAGSEEETQTLSFSISTNTVGFASLNSSAPRFATGDESGSDSEAVAHTLIASTNSANGYNIIINGNTLTSSSGTITAIGASTVNVTDGNGTEQFGIRVVAADGSGEVNSPYNGAANYYALATANFPDQIASASSGDGVATTYSVYYGANIADITTAGDYIATLTYVCTGSF